MEIAEAAAIAGRDELVKDYMKDGYYLSSLMAIPEKLDSIEKWTLVYFHPVEKKVISVELENGVVKTGSPADPLVDDHYSELGHSGCLETKSLLGMIVDILAKEKEFPTKAIITLRDGEWKIAIVTKSLKLLRIDLDMKTGETKKIENSSLISTA